MTALVMGGGDNKWEIHGGNAFITVTAPMATEPAAGAQIPGCGITLASPLMKPHDNGAPVTGDLLTPARSAK